MQPSARDPIDGGSREKSDHRSAATRRSRSGAKGLSHATAIEAIQTVMAGEYWAGRESVSNLAQSPHLDAVIA